MLLTIVFLYFQINPERLCKTESSGMASHNVNNMATKVNVVEETEDRNTEPSATYCSQNKDTVTQEDLSEISRKIPYGKWRQILIECFGIHDNEIYKVEYVWKGDGLEMVIFNALLDWQRRCASSVTREHLYNILVKAEEKHIVEDSSWCKFLISSHETGNESQSSDAMDCNAILMPDEAMDQDSESTNEVEDEENPLLHGVQRENEADNQVKTEISSMSDLARALDVKNPIYLHLMITACIIQLYYTDMKGAEHLWYSITLVKNRLPLRSKSLLVWSVLLGAHLPCLFSWLLRKVTNEKRPLNSSLCIFAGTVTILNILVSAAYGNTLDGYIINIHLYIAVIQIILYANASNPMYYSFSSNPVVASKLRGGFHTFLNIFIWSSLGKMIGRLILHLSNHTVLTLKLHTNVTTNSTANVETIYFTRQASNEIICTGLPLILVFISLLIWTQAKFNGHVKQQDIQINPLNFVLVYGAMYFYSWSLDLVTPESKATFASTDYGWRPTNLFEDFSYRFYPISFVPSKSINCDKEKLYYPHFIICDAVSIILLNLIRCHKIRKFVPFVALYCTYASILTAIDMQQMNNINDQFSLLGLFLLQFVYPWYSFNPVELPGQLHANIHIGTTVYSNRNHTLKLTGIPSLDWFLDEFTIPCPPECQKAANGTTTLLVKTDNLKSFCI